MSRLLMRTLRHHGVTGSLAKSLHCKMSGVPPLQASLESSVELLLQYRPDDVVSCFKERGNKNMDDLHPLEKNVYALGLLFSGDLEQSLDMQTQTVKYFTQSLGSTSDSFLDIAGSINDLAVINMAYGDLSAAEKGFKRALLMVERSYKIDTHLRSTLLANLSNVHRISGNKDSCLHYIEQLLPLLSPNYKVQKQASVDISTLNPAESQEALDQFWKELTQPVSHNDDITKGDPKKITTDSSTVPEKFYNCKHLFTSVRKIQFILLTGHCIGTMRLHEEGLIYMNMAFEAILSNSLIEHAGCDLLVKDSFILSAALMKLADLSNHSHVTRRKGISAKHIEHDHVARLFKLPYFRDKYPSISDLDISLTSSFRDLKNAATQVYKSKISQQLTVKSIVRGDSEYERMLFSNIGVVGIALLDIEHYAAKHSSPNA